jgi:hypothetical protein
MSLPTAENLHVALKQVLHEVKLTLAELQRVVHRYRSIDVIAQPQGTRQLNSELRELGLAVGKTQRTELVLCQIILMTWFLIPTLKSTAELCAMYGFDEKDVAADKTLAEFVWFMDQALILVAGKGHMEFLISDVVAPLSEKLSGRKYPAGGGTESIGTTMRYTVFERETGYVRPKSRRRSDSDSPVSAEGPSAKKGKGQHSTKSLLPHDMNHADTLFGASDSFLPELTEQQVLDLILFDASSSTE